MRHKDKVQLARKMQTGAEKLKDPPPGVYHGIFQSLAWTMRNIAIADRVRKQQEAAHARAIARRSGTKPGFLTRVHRVAAAALQRRIETRRIRHAKHLARTTPAVAQ